MYVCTLAAHPAQGYVYEGACLLGGIEWETVCVCICVWCVCARVCVSRCAYVGFLHGPDRLNRDPPTPLLRWCTVCLQAATSNPYAA